MMIVVRYFWCDVAKAVMMLNSTSGSWLGKTGADWSSCVAALKASVEFFIVHWNRLALAFYLGIPVIVTVQNFTLNV